MSLGDTVRTLRKAQGWTQVELAQKSGIAQGMLTNIERGRNTNPTRNTLSRLAVALGTSINELTGDVLNSAESDITLTQWGEELLSIGSDLSSDERKAVLDHARALRDRHTRG